VGTPTAGMDMTMASMSMATITMTTARMGTTMDMITRTMTMTMRMKTNMSTPRQLLARRPTSTARTAGTTTAMAMRMPRPRSQRPFRCSSTSTAPPVPDTAAATAAIAAAPTGFTPGLLQLIWLASPALPVGGFSYSEGLEAAVEWGRVANEAQAANWIADQLHLSLARGDLAVLVQAVPAARAGDVARLRALDDWVRLTRETSELRLQSEQMGRSLADWLRGLHPEDAALFADWKPTYPVAFAVAAARSDAAPADIGAAFAFGWSENMVQTAIKSVPLGQSAGQRMLARLAGEIPAALRHALSLDDDGRQALSPMLAILSSRHEVQYSRLFRS
jgi:urease accessory protein